MCNEPWCDIVPSIMDGLNQPIGISDKKLSNKETITILENALQDRRNISVYPPITPKGGEYYLLNRGEDVTFKCK